MALFQSGTYNLAAVADRPASAGASRCCRRSEGPGQRHQRHCCRGQFGHPHPDAVREVLAWMGSSAATSIWARSGAAIPAVLAAQPVYFDYWAARGVDVTPFFRVLDGPRIPAPGGAGFAAGYQALKPYFDEMFLGRRDVARTLAAAQAAANAAAER